jgi:hypothetical protein
LWVYSGIIPSKPGLVNNLPGKFWDTLEVNKTLLGRTVSIQRPARSRFLCLDTPIALFGILLGAPGAAGNARDDVINKNILPPFRNIRYFNFVK